MSLAVLWQFPAVCDKSCLVTCVHTRPGKIEQTLRTPSRGWNTIWAVQGLMKPHPNHGTDLPWLLSQEKRYSRLCTGGTERIHAVLPLLLHARRCSASSNSLCLTHFSIACCRFSQQLITGPCLPQLPCCDRLCLPCLVCGTAAYQRGNYCETLCVYSQTALCGCFAGVMHACIS